VNKLIDFVNKMTKNIHKEYSEVKEKLKNKLSESIKELNVDVEYLKKAKIELENMEKEQINT
jgi:hypothetical protein